MRMCAACLLHDGCPGARVSVLSARLFALHGRRDPALHGMPASGMGVLGRKKVEGRQ